MEFTVRHFHAVSEDRYWNDIFLSHEYTKALYLEGLGFAQCEIEKQETDAQGRIERVVWMKPEVKLPDPIQKLMGHHIEYREHGVWDPTKKTWTFRMAPGTLADKTSIDGVIRVYPRDGGIDRECVTRVDIRIFGLGRIVEQFIERSTRDNLDKAAQFTNAFIKSHF
jgi:hypothetical protein